MNTRIQTHKITEGLSNKFSNMAFLSAFLVVLIHARHGCLLRNPIDNWAAYMICNGICTIAVPFFFCTSGFFLAGHTMKDGWWGGEIKKRLRTLLLPFVVWSLIYVVYSSALSLMANILHSTEWTRHLPLSIDSWLSVFGLSFDARPFYFPLWYVRQLILLVFFSAFFVGIVHKGKLWGGGWYYSCCGWHGPTHFY